MDNLTHALVGATMSRAVAGTTRRNPVWWAFLLASEVPDIDVLYLLKGPTSYLVNHRGWTHSLPGLALLSLGVALLVFWAARGGGTFRSLFAVSLLASTVHVALDALTSWGTGLLHPFQTGWVYLDILPIIDPVLYGVLFAGLLAARFGPDQKRAVKIALAAMLIFIAARGALHFAAVDFLEGAGGNGRPLAMPTVNPLKWRVVIERPGGFELGRLDLGTGAFEETAKVPTAGSAAVSDHTLDPGSGAVLNFFRVPVFSVVDREGSKFLLMKDLSYDRGIREVLLETKSPSEPGVWYKAVK